MPPHAQTSTRRKRLTAEDRRVALLDAAVEVFARRGYHAASIDEIAHAAGISKALIYEHFPSKKDLHLALLERHAGQILDALAVTVSTSDRPEKRLRTGVDGFFGWVEDQPHAFRVLFRDALEADAAEMLATLQARATVAIAALMSAAPHGGEDPLLIETYAQMLSGAVQSLALWWQDHRDVDRSFLVDRVMDFAWVGLGWLTGERR